VAPIKIKIKRKSNESFLKKLKLKETFYNALVGLTQILEQLTFHAE